MQIALCQINTRVGDLDSNTAKIKDFLAKAESAGADLVVFPELTIPGYPPEDLVLKPGFVSANLDALHKLAVSVGRCRAIVGFVDRTPDGSRRNAAALLGDGKVLAVTHKRALPNYGLFDEKRLFDAGTGSPEVTEIAGVKVGISICEDAWVDDGPIPDLAASGAELVININSSPYYRDKFDVRVAAMQERVADVGLPLVYVNQVGGQDEVIFDGQSFVLDSSGTVVTRAAHCDEEMRLVQFDSGVISGEPATEHESLDELYECLVLATRDYVDKNGFTDVYIGLSGGIDSALTAAIAFDALGADRVHAVSMPSRYSSDHSRSDAADMANRLGISYQTIPIEAAHTAFMGMLDEPLSGYDAGLAEENLQSRIRGVILMGLANAANRLVLTTGNKSEAAVGYSTLYGDTAGAYAVIKDVYKLDVYRLAHRFNQRHGVELIPSAIIEKAPSAELRPDQTDAQSLPDYEDLDPLLEAYIEGDATVAELIEAGFEPEMCNRITRLVDIAEFKRRQTPLGPRVTKKGFGRDRRLPITNAFR